MFTGQLRPTLVKAASVRGERGELSDTCDTLGPSVSLSFPCRSRGLFSRSYSRILTGAGVTSSSFVLNSRDTRVSLQNGLWQVSILVLVTLISCQQCGDGEKKIFWIKVLTSPALQFFVYEVNRCKIKSWTESSIVNCFEQSTLWKVCLKCVLWKASP